MIESVQTTALLDSAARGDASAVNALLDCYRERLMRMIAYRMDGRLRGRVDPADILQEALLVANRQLRDYLTRRPLPFFLWLRQIAWEQLVHTHERHLQAQKRSVTREREPGAAQSSSSGSRGKLADCATSLTTPSKIMMRGELRARMMQQLERLPACSQEVLVLRYLEQLSVKEMAALLQISRGAAQMRIVRALEALRNLIDDSTPESHL